MSEPAVVRVNAEAGNLVSTCTVCGKFATEPNKGIGRARIATWESNHGPNCYRLHLLPQRTSPVAEDAVPTEE